MKDSKKIKSEIYDNMTTRELEDVNNSCREGNIISVEDVWKNVGCLLK